MGLGVCRTLHLPLQKLKEVRHIFSGFCPSLATRQSSVDDSGTFLLKEGTVREITPSAVVLSNEGIVISSVAFSPDFSFA